MSAQSGGPDVQLLVQLYTWQLVNSPVQELNRARRALGERKPRRSVAEATNELLASEKRPMSNTEIGQRLQAGGVKISSGSEQYNRFSDHPPGK